MKLLRALLFFAAIAGTAHAHMLNMTRALVSFGPDRSMRLKIDVDLSLALGGVENYERLFHLPADEQRATFAEVGSRLLDELQFTIDDAPAPLAFAQGKLPDVPPEQIGDVTVAANATLEFSSTVPEGAHVFALQTSPVANVEFPLALSVQFLPQGTIVTRWLELPGMRSRTFALPENSPPPTDALAHDSTNAAQSKPASNAEPELSPLETGIARRIATAMQYLRLGFRHIVPQGTDHILFVLGLFFLGLRRKPLVWQTTIFTVAHTTTLGLSAYGVFSLPSRFVEPMIALSIAFIAVEDLMRPKLGPWRLVIVFCFGLVHGLGFASSLQEVPMPRDQFFTALLGFNFGVDFAQLGVIATAFLTVGWFRNKPWYRRRIVVPCCAAISIIALWWAFERTFL